jgi:release factor glutamine methyltransferase
VKLAQALNSARDTLAQKDIEDASLEAEILLRHTLKIDRTQLYLDFEKELNPEDEKAFEALITRRLKGEPSAYIIGHREFYGRDFYVNAHTLIPRPESELLVETALRTVKERQLHTIADIGTGCGAIAITLALEIPNAKIYATDLSAKALEVAEVNCKRHGADGVRQAKGKLKDDGSMLLEVGQGQSGAITGLLHHLFPSGITEVLPDLGGIERVASLNLSEAKVAG